MTVTRVLHAVALLLLQGGFPGAGSETVTVKEGEDLTLHCTFSPPSAAHSSALQWLNPRGFTIFLNSQQVLRDKRYKLIHYSEDELSIQLSQVTVHDEGSYRCFYYGRPFQSKAQPVEVLAAPSNPVLEVSQGTERGITLSCYTQGCKPQPRVTWLLDNGMELPVCVSVANHKPNLQYVAEGYGETTLKNPSDKTTAISEKRFACGKETDV
ncbi:PREDICTED: cytotoxic and regulatory T-cell molecule [Lepidothrix coronata]|uniref:Cytotoxic and regulatory T-cell molecule n=1 Tax=Lepidothrix coronata TaxID=321398 RepID=A0A6J0GSY3_9PASS|nr:PREDICTED: cytotoxic and regulatory T-cell molecule [Lepidothrix coronata]